ncbi:hypothetical protein GQF42_01370 [Streptomyces broussonetiae]|uniref:ATP-binding protein n=1 Tax=Streptomyces broussonetiae TaxID=2686304 RepID=A0A6I6MPM1_9ACTN|nr:ATP-binding protein [Streptomyces broussonetiae]QHA02173.1 hypothetical protein GQF42_01370 [Streptomyces broussonetiae]
MNPATQQCITSAQDDDAVTSAASEDVTASHPVSATLVLMPLQPEDLVLLQWDGGLLANEGIRRNARLMVRTRLTVANWTGDVEAGARIAAELASNAARHGRPFTDGRVVVRLHLPSEDDELCIEVDDADPAFADFEAAADGHRGAESGLGFARRQGARLSWEVKRVNGLVIGKTVRALVPAGREGASA